MLTEEQKDAAFDSGVDAGSVNGHLGSDAGLVAAHTYANEFDGQDIPEQRIARIFHFARGWQWGSMCPVLGVR